MSSIKTVSILGAGWLGFPLGKRLKQLGYHIKASTTDPQKIDEFNALGFEPYAIKIPTQDPIKLEGDNLSAFFETDIIVITLPFRRSLTDPTIYKRQVQAILTHLNTDRQTKILFTSSTSIYPNTNGLVTEDTPHDATNPRAVVLHDTEQLCLANPTQHPATIIRFAGLIGPDRIPGRFFAGKTNIPNPTAPVNLIHLDDCLDIMQAIIEKEIYNEIFNGVGSDHPNRKTYYTQQAQKYGFEVPQFEPENSQGFKVVCNKKVKSSLKRFRNKEFRS